MQEDQEVDQEEIHQDPPTFITIRKSSLNTPGFSTKNKITKAISVDDYIICEAPDNKKIIIYDTKAHAHLAIKVHANDFVIELYPPYLFCCGIGQYLYLWEREPFLNFMNYSLAIQKKSQNLQTKTPNSSEVVGLSAKKAKISKMKIKALVQVNKGVFIAGKNKSVLAGKKQTSRRSIYYLEELSFKKKNKPIFQIQLPKSRQPVTILRMLGIHLLCYLFPYIYIINVQKVQILVSFSIQVRQLHFMREIYHTNFLNLIGINTFTRELIKCDIEQFPIYGMQLHETKIKAVGCCVSPGGKKIYVTDGKKIFEYNPHTNKITRQIYSENSESNIAVDRHITEIFCHSESLLIAIKQSTKSPLGSQSEISDVKSQSFSGTKSEELKLQENKEQKFCSVQIIHI